MNRSQSFVFCFALFLLANCKHASRVQEESAVADFGGSLPPPLPPIPPPLSDSKQLAVRALLAGTWVSGCLSMPDGNGTNIFLTSSWTFAADGRVETQPTEYGDAACTQLRTVQGALVGQLVAVKEIAGNQYYIKHLLPEGSQILMIKVDGSRLMLASMRDTEASTLSGTIMQFAKK